MMELMERTAHWPKPALHNALYSRGPPVALLGVKGSTHLCITNAADPWRERIMHTTSFVAQKIDNACDWECRSPEVFRARRSALTSGMQKAPKNGLVLLLLWGLLGLLTVAPAMAIPLPCDTCDDSPPPPPPPPPPSYTCNYSPDDQTSTLAPSSGTDFQALIQRATRRTVYAGSCATATCPSPSQKIEWPFGSACECWTDTIPQLRSTGTPNWEMHKIRYAVLLEPSVAQTESIVIALAGQNGLSSSSSGNGGPGNLTGQPQEWDKTCNDWDCGTKSFDSRSFVARVLGRHPTLGMFPLLNPANTFAASFADHRYDWGSQDKYRISEGIAQWIASKGSPPMLKQIIVVGHSRGGCLALSIVAWLRASSVFNNVRILAVPVDPTCEIGEMGTSTANIDNPQSGDAEGYAWRSSFSLNNSNQVCIHNIVNGHSNWSPPFHNIHNVYLNSWKNTWSTIPHVTLGTCFENNVREKCEPSGNNLVKQEVLDRALRFIGLNLAP